MLRSTLGFLALISMVGCAGGPGAGDAGGGTGGSTGPFETADHTPLPLVSAHNQGVIKNVQLVTLTFAGYAHEAEAQAFGDWVVTSDYFVNAVAEYGAGPGTNTNVVSPDAPPTSDSALIDYITAQSGPGGILPPPSLDVHYQVYLPAHATFTGAGGKLCSSLLGYHWYNDYYNPTFTYSVIPTCGSFGEVTGTTTHEVIEAVTDPLNGWWVDAPKNDPFWYETDDEIGDLCEYYKVVQSDGFVVQRIWSNAAAKAGTSPCLPLPADDEYFNVSASPATIPTAPAGGSFDFELTGWSVDETDDWYIFAEGEPSYSDFNVTTKLDKHIINNGETATLTVTLPANAKSGKGGVAGIYSTRRHCLDSKYGCYGDDFARFWLVAVRAE